MAFLTKSRAANLAVLCLFGIGTLAGPRGEIAEADAGTSPPGENSSLSTAVDEGLEVGETPPGDGDDSVGTGRLPVAEPLVKERDSFFTRLAESPWFAVGSGLASFIGVLLALYQMRVRYYAGSRLRLLELQRVAVLAAGVGLATFASISFYLQPYPPGFLPFRYIYDLGHGTCANRWDEWETRFGATFQTSNETVTVTHVIALNPGITRIEFEASCHPPGFCRPFPDPAIAVASSGLLQPVQRRNNLSSARNRVSGYLDFPSIYDRCGVLRIWSDQSVASQEDGTLGNASLYLTTDIRETGSSIWAILALAGLVLFVIGFASKPLQSMQRHLMEEGADLRRREDDELRAILVGRSYDELSTDEKLRFEDTRAYYARNLDLLFERATGLPGRIREASHDGPPGAPAGRPTELGITARGEREG